jgi:hypothetical protein
MSDFERWKGILEHQANSDGPLDYKHKVLEGIADLEARLAAAESQPAVPEWRLIESAPKDGMPILLRSKYGAHGDGYWLQSARDGVGAWVWPYLRNEPWFWMPLPAAPQGGGE